MTDTAGRFHTEQDTPCPFRLARFGYVRLGEFRVPAVGELYIAYSQGPSLRDDEPRILKLEERSENFEGTPHHIVRPISEQEQEMMENPFLALLGVMTGAFDEPGSDGGPADPFEDAA